MNETNKSTALATSVIKDDGVQRAAAGLAISVVVAVAKVLIFPNA